MFSPTRPRSLDRNSPDSSPATSAQAQQRSFATNVHDAWPTFYAQAATPSKPSHVASDGPTPATPHAPSVRYTVCPRSSIGKSLDHRRLLDTSGRQLCPASQVRRPRHRAREPAREVATTMSINPGEASASTSTNAADPRRKISPPSALSLGIIVWTDDPEVEPTVIAGRKIGRAHV